MPPPKSSEDLIEIWLWPAAPDPTELVEVETLAAVVALLVV
jgi:hypothetical protein